MTISGKKWFGMLTGSPFWRWDNYLYEFTLWLLELSEYDQLLWKISNGSSLQLCIRMEVDRETGCSYCIVSALIADVFSEPVAWDICQTVWQLKVGGMQSLTVARWHMAPGTRNLLLPQSVGVSELWAQFSFRHVCYWWPCLGLLYCQNGAQSCCLMRIRSVDLAGSRVQSQRVTGACSVAPPKNTCKLPILVTLCNNWPSVIGLSRLCGTLLFS